MWSPASSLWGRLLNFEADRVLAPEENRSIVRTPLVIAMWEPFAEALGWPQRSLFLSEVVTSWGEHHLVLVVRTDKGDLVLDNLAGSVRPLQQARYRLVRAQKPGNPKAWFEIIRRGGNIVSASRETASQKS